MSQDTEAHQLVIFTLGVEQYALPIEQVQEIIRYQQPRSIVSDDISVCGVINLRGKIVPVHDLATRLRINAEVGQQDRIIVLDSSGHTVGVIVDSVDEVLTIDADQLDPVPAAADATMAESIAKIGDRLVSLLNPNAVTGDLLLAA